MLNVERSVGGFICETKSKTLSFMDDVSRDVRDETGGRKQIQDILVVSGNTDISTCSKYVRKPGDTCDGRIDSCFISPQTRRI